MAFTYLQIHIENEETSFISKIGLPNTKNIIRKWSMEHLNGLDLSNFALPPDARQQKLNEEIVSKVLNLSNATEMEKPN